MKKTTLLFVCLIPLLAGCGSLSFNKESKVQYIRADTDRREIQIQYVDNQAIEVRKLVDGLSWLSVSDKEQLNQTLTSVAGKVPELSKQYHEACNGSDQPYYESFSYFIDQYLGAAMRVEDQMTKAMNKTILFTKEIRRDSKCRNKKSCNEALSTYFMNEYNQNINEYIQEAKTSRRMIDALIQKKFNE